MPGAQSTDLAVFSPSAIGLISPGTQSARVGARVALPVTSLGAAAGESLSYAASGLPPGLSIARNGNISGTVAAAAAPKAAVNYHVTVSVKNAGGATAAMAFSWGISPA